MVVIVVIVIIDLFAIVFGLSFMRARKARRPGAPRPASWRRPPPAKAVSRRDFFARVAADLA